jgi:tetratricopeptide (TPR) repeat protein
MSADRIAQLHEQASEQYLNGNYDGALQAWRDVLALDPGNEQAMDGVRMASQFAAPAGVSAPVTDDVDRDLDQGLRVFDSLGTSRQAASAAQAAGIKPDPMRQTEGIDFGDLSGVSAIPLGSTDSPPIDTIPAADPAPVEEEETFGLAPLSAASSGASAAALELNRRVADLLAEAHAKADAGEKDEALSILSRLAILDDENAEAAELRTKLLEGGPSDLDKVEAAIIEGVAALESDRLDDAERLFRDALALAPGHREAEHYLEKVHERRAGTAPGGLHDGEDLLGGGLLGNDTASTPAAPELPPNAAVPLAAPAKAPRPPRGPAAATAAPVQPNVGTRGLPPLKWIVGGGLLAVAAVAAFVAVPRFISGGKPHANIPPPPPAARPAAPARPAGATTATSPASNINPQERAKQLAESLERAQARMNAGDFGAAVVSYNEALKLDPANLEAKAGLNEAGDRYKAHKAEEEAIGTIKISFKDGEYTTALRLAYRLPASVPPAYVSGIKVAGWYNLAVVALRAGDCKEAISHLDEGLGVTPGEPDTTKLREFAMRYADAPKDRSFLDQVEALVFKPMPSL